MKPTLIHDRDANAIHIRFSGHELAETLELSNSACVALDAKGETVGLEIQHAADGSVSGTVKPVRGSERYRGTRDGSAPAALRWKRSTLNSKTAHRMMSRFR